MFIFDILTYVILTYIMYSLALKSYIFNPLSNKIDIYIWAYIIFFTIITAIRYQVGQDYLGYKTVFSDGLDEARNGEYLWFTFVNTLKGLGLHYTIGLGIIGFLQIYSITKALNQYKYILVFLPIVMFGGRYFLDLMNGMRQMIVACGFVWASKFIYEKKFWKYFLFIAIASTIHQSALMLIPLYFIPNKFSIIKHRFIQFLILGIFFILGQNHSFQGAGQYIEGAGNLFGYGHYNDFIAGHINNSENQEILGFGPIMLSYLLVSIFIIWFSPYLNNKFSKKIPYFNQWYNYSFFYSILYFLVCNDISATRIIPSV